MPDQNSVSRVKESFQQSMKEIRSADTQSLSNQISLLGHLNRSFENGASFYEKLIALDGAAIGLSLTFVTTSHIALRHTAAFGLLLPDWVIFLLSMWMAWHRVASFHSVPIFVTNRLYALNTHQHKEAASYWASQMESVLQSEVSDLQALANAKQSLSELAVRFKTDADKAKEQGEELLQRALDEEKRTLKYARAAALLSILGIVLLCAFVFSMLKSGSA